MKLRSLKIERMEGFLSKGFALKKEHLEADITMIVGPNGSGKTSICRALSALLWPVKDASDEMILSALWEENGHTIEMKLSGHQKQQIVDDPAYEVALPPFHLRNCYIITLDDLFDAKDGDFAHDVYLQSRGGFDFSLLYPEAKSKITGRQEYLHLQEVHRALRSLESRYEALLQRELNLSALEKKIEAAKEAGAALSVIDELLSLKKNEQEVQEKELARRAFPELLSRLVGDEDAILENILQKIMLIEGDQRQALQKMAVMEEKLGHFSHLQAETLFTRLCKHTLPRLQRSEKERAEIEKKLFEIKNNLLFTSNFLGLDLSFFQKGSITEVNELYSLWKNARKLKEVQSALRARLATLKGESAYSKEELSSAIDLVYQKSHLMDESKKERIAYAIAAIFGLALGMIDPWLSLSAGIPLTFSLYFSSRRKALLKQIEEGLSISSDLPTLYSALEESLLTSAQKMLKNDLELELQHCEQQLNTLYQQFLEKQNMDLDYEEHIALFLDQYSRGLELAAHYDHLEKELSTLFITHRESLEEVNRFCGQLNIAPIISCAEAEELFDRLSKEFEELHFLSQEKNKEQDKIKKLEEQRAFYLFELKKLYDRLGVEKIELAELKQHLQELPHYQEIVKLHRRLKEKQDLLLDKVKEHSEWKVLSEVELVELKMQMQERYQGYEELIKELCDTQSAVEKSSHSEELQKLELEYRLAKESLQNKYDHSLEELLAQSLLESVEEEYRTFSQSPLLKKAAEWFLHFTHGSYELRLASYEKGEPQFFAYDTKNEELKPLKALSRGTRIQLLLAVRLAFSEMHEDPDRPLPFVFDEAFSNFDPARFEAVCEALTLMAKKGRQVLYFSCRPEEAALWRNQLLRHENVSLCCLELEKIKTQSDAQFTPALPSPIVQTESLSLSDCASRFNIKSLHSAPSSHHVDIYHLVSTAAELQTLYRMHIKTYGQLKAVMNLGKIPFGPQQLSLFQTKGALLEHYFRLKKIGEGKKLYRSILEKSGISESFIDQVCNLAEELDWNARSLFSELTQGKKVKRLRQQDIFKSKEFLIEEGFLDEKEALSEEEIQERLFQFSKQDLEQNKISVEELTQFIQSLSKN